MRVCILILCVCLVSYLFKIFGSDIFNKFITNDIFIKISVHIDSVFILNILCYGILGYIITQFTFCMTCGKLKVKWFEYLIVFAFAIGMSVLRFYYTGALILIFDILQYIIVPTIYGTLTRKQNLLKNIFCTLMLYSAYCGLIIFNMQLCDLKQIMYYDNFFAYVLCLIEVYLFIISFTMFIINGGFNNGKSSISIIEEKRTNERIQRDKKC